MFANISGDQEGITRHWRPKSKNGAFIAGPGRPLAPYGRHILNYDKMTEHVCHLYFVHP